MTATCIVVDIIFKSCFLKKLFDLIRITNKYPSIRQVTEITVYKYNTMDRKTIVMTKETFVKTISPNFTTFWIL